MMSSVRPLYEIWNSRMSRVAISLFFCQFVGIIFLVLLLTDYFYSEEVWMMMPKLPRQWLQNVPKWQGSCRLQTSKTDWTALPLALPGSFVFVAKKTSWVLCVCSEKGKFVPPLIARSSSAISNTPCCRSNAHHHHCRLLSSPAGCTVLSTVELSTVTKQQHVFYRHFLCP